MLNRYGPAPPCLTRTPFFWGLDWVGCCDSWPAFSPADGSSGAWRACCSLIGWPWLRFSLPPPGFVFIISTIIWNLGRRRFGRTSKRIKGNHGEIELECIEFISGTCPGTGPWGRPISQIAILTFRANSVLNKRAGRVIRLQLTRIVKWETGGNVWWWSQERARNEMLICLQGALPIADGVAWPDSVAKWDYSHLKALEYQFSRIQSDLIELHSAAGLALVVVSLAKKTCNDWNDWEGNW